MPKSKELTFEEQLKRLDAIVNALETQEVDLEQSLKLFEEGIQLTRHCQKRLQDAKKKVEILTQDSDTLKPFSEGDLSS